jgi:hypothetical protein
MVSSAIHAELAKAYGTDLGAAIADATFYLNGHGTYGHTGAPVACARCRG